MQPTLRIVAVAAVASVAACGGSPASRVEPAPRTAAAPSAAPSAASREQTADEQVNHVLSRLTFGARPGDAEAVRAMGVDQWIDLQLHPERIDDTKSDQYFAALESYRSTSQQLMQKYPPPNQLLQRLQAKGDRSKLSHADSIELSEATAGVRKVTVEAQSGRIDRALLTERQLQEVMTDFWLNHFTVYIQKGPPERYQLAQYESKVIRPNSLGKFRALLGAVAKSPAMLFYLDNWESQADSNRPRLAALPGGGRGAARRRAPQRARRPTDPAATAAARPTARRSERKLRPRACSSCTRSAWTADTRSRTSSTSRARFTGWTFPRPQLGGGAFEFHPQMHDAGEKIVLGHKLPAGRGMEDGEDVLDIVARHPSTAKYIALQARAAVRQRHAAAGTRRARRGDLPPHRRRHPGSAAHDRHEPGVLLARGVSQQGEVAVRGGRERAPGARRADPTARRAPRRRSRRSASRSTGTRRRTDGRRPATSG